MKIPGGFTRTGEKKEEADQERKRHTAAGNTLWGVNEFQNPSSNLLMGHEPV
jgi:hypothetical protein